MSAVSEAVNAVLTTPLKLDIGCGKNKKAGFIGIDLYDFDGVDIVADLRLKTWYLTKVPAELQPRLVEVDDDETPHLEVSSFKLPDNSVDEAHASHFLEHLTNFGDKWERVRFFNELHRIMKPGATAQIIFPHWSSNRYYGDPTHKEPFSEMGFCYLNRAWRLDQNNAPHADVSVNPNGYSCDFDWTYGYGIHPLLTNRVTEYQQYALTFWKEAATDIISTITKRQP
jgi:predicted SAM-dependent methyltransferase